MKRITIFSLPLIALASVAYAAAVYGPLPPPGYAPPKVAARPAAPAGIFNRFLSWLKKPSLPLVRPSASAPARPVVNAAPTAKPALAARPAVPAMPAPLKPAQAPRPVSAAAAPEKAPARNFSPAPVAMRQTKLPATVKQPAASPTAPLAKALRAAMPVAKIAAPEAKHSSVAAKASARASSALPSTVKRAPASAAPAVAKRPSLPKYAAPLPSAPALPAAASVNVPDLQMPALTKVTVLRDPLPALKLGGRNHDGLLNASRNARLSLLPTREYSLEREAPGIAARYSAALHPTPHRAIRSPYKLRLEKLAKISGAPAPIHYENMVKRLDALFDGLDMSYPKGIAALWDLSEQKDNPKRLQARDALFAGILAERAHYETVSGNLIEAALRKGLDREDRYLKILFAELENFETLSHIDRVAAQVNPLRADLAAPEGDKANYALARRLLAGRAQPGLSSERFAARIGNPALRDRLELLRSVARLRLKASDPAAPLASLRRLEAEGHESVREEARLALARVLLQKGSANEALALYRQVTKDGKNRLEVLSEQSYAEYRAGLYQDSLGKAVGLMSPYFQYGFAPDIHLVEILSRQGLCDFGGADDGVQRFVERYGRELSGLRTALVNKPNPRGFYEELISYHAKEEPLRYQRFLLRLAPVMENQKALHAAQLELAKLAKVGTKEYSAPRPQNWDKFRAAMATAWGERAEKLKLEAARTALNEAAYMEARLRHTFGQVELLGLDVATTASRNFNLQSALNFPVRKLAQLELEKDKFHWPFEQEIWEDELDFLKMKNPSKCAARPVAQN